MNILFMSKNKINIRNKKFSWENDMNTKICDQKNCKKLGEYRAPKSRTNLNTYLYFCLQHVKEYNKSWDFYKGLSVDEIELSLRKDIIWDRPSWPLSGHPNKILDQINTLFDSDYKFFEKERDLSNFTKNKIINHNLTQEEQKSMTVLGLKMPINIEKIKKAYKKLVKIFHPDVNKKNKDAEKLFKDINQAYRILLKKFLTKS